MSKKALVVGINDYSNWNNGGTVNGVSLSAPNLHWYVADSNSFGQLLTDGFVLDEVTTLQELESYVTGDFERD